jgi:hypothetical protein
MSLRHHEISETGHRILNLFTEEKPMVLGEICRLRGGQRQLDLACGKGELLCRWAERLGHWSRWCWRTATAGTGTRRLNGGR